jgi:hypothetical protein
MDVACEMTISVENKDENCAKGKGQGKCRVIEGLSGKSSPWLNKEKTLATAAVAQK